jgi:hypothetical protein
MGLYVSIEFTVIFNIIVEVYIIINICQEKNRSPAASLELPPGSHGFNGPKEGSKGDFDKS